MTKSNIELKGASPEQVKAVVAGTKSNIELKGEFSTKTQLYSQSTTKSNGAVV